MLINSSFFDEPCWYQQGFFHNPISPPGKIMVSMQYLRYL